MRFSFLVRISIPIYISYENEWSVYVQKKYGISYFITTSMIILQFTSGRTYIHLKGDIMATKYVYE